LCDQLLLDTPLARTLDLATAIARWLPRGSSVSIDWAELIIYRYPQIELFVLKARGAHSRDLER
jgi:hypothetical protein